MAPARLHKKETQVSPVNHIFDKIEAWVLSHASIFLFIALVMLFVLFVMLIWLLTGVSATESGVTYNQFNNIV